MVENGDKFITVIQLYDYIKALMSLNTPMKKDIIRVNSERGVKYLICTLKTHFKYEHAGIP